MFQARRQGEGGGGGGQRVRSTPTKKKATEVHFFVDEWFKTKWYYLFIKAAQYPQGFVFIVFWIVILMASRRFEWLVPALKRCFHDIVAPIKAPYSFKKFHSHSVKSVA